jgi:hypothetical protein
MLNKVNFPLTNTQISRFFLDKEYTTYFVFQQVITELLEAGLIFSETVRNTSYYKITDSGIETVEMFADKIPVAVVDDMDIFLIDNKYEMRNEVGTTSDYYLSANGQDYIVTCQIKEGNNNLIEINITVPSEDVAEIMCNNWRDSSQDIYSAVMKTLTKQEKKQDKKYNKAKAGSM